MKKILSGIMVLLLCAMACSQEKAILYYKAIDNNINIRTEPNTKCQKLGQLFYNDVIKVYPEKSTKEWLYCFVPKINNYGYCYSEYFVIYEPFIYEIIGQLLEENPFYYEMVESGNVGETDSTDVFYLSLETIIKYPEEKVFKLLKYLLEKKLIYDTTQEGNLLTECVELNYLTIVEYLLDETDSKDLINSTYTSYYGPPILFAVLRNYPEMLELLLKKGADPNAPARNKEKMFYWINQKIEEGEYSEESGKVLRKILLKYGYVE